MTIVSGAAAEVNVANEKNGNIQVEVKAEHLAKLGLLTPPATSYVVWFQQQGSDDRGLVNATDKHLIRIKKVPYAEVQ